MGGFISELSILFYWSLCLCYASPILFESLCCSAAQLCLTIRNPMDCSMPGFPVLHHLPELAQTHVHWIGDAIQPSHPLSSASPLAFNLSQHQSFLMSWLLELLSVQFSSVTQSCPSLCDPMNCSTPGLPVHHQLPEFTQTHVHQVGNAIQPSHPLSSPSPPAPNPSQHQGLFQWVNSSHEAAKVTEFQL